MTEGVEFAQRDAGDLRILPFPCGAIDEGGCDTGNQRVVDALGELCGLVLSRRDDRVIGELEVQQPRPQGVQQVLEAGGRRETEMTAQFQAQQIEIRALADKSVELIAQLFHPGVVSERACA